MLDEIRDHRTGGVDRVRAFDRGRGELGGVAVAVMIGRQPVSEVPHLATQQRATAVADQLARRRGGDGHLGGRDRPKPG